MRVSEMKIVLVDNYNRETVADVLYVEHLHPWIATWMVREWQNRLWSEMSHTDRWPVVKDDNYRLSRGMEDLV
jgi:hypothetical protein